MTTSGKPSPEPQDARGLAREAADTISRELAELGVRVPDDLREPIASEIRKAIRTALAQSDAISRSGEREKSPLITDVQEHRDAAYQNGWDDGYAEGYGKAHALAQSDAEPVAWRYAYPDYPGRWNVTSDKLIADERRGNAGCIVEPLYAAPPRPDASAWVIEADEILNTLKHARTFITSREKMHPTGVELYDELIERLRSRAADRGVHGDLIPDCPTDGVAARQGNGG